jgi:putative Mg2+ transporter-C (MgtC) family protein
VTNLPDAEIALRLLTALAAGAAIGLERTYHGRPAGFRTYALVCLGPAFLVIFGASLAPGDPAATSRIAQGVLTGIGFLGAGVIFKEGLSVHGLTTAASIWTAAGLGLLFGSGAWAPAGIGWLVVLVTLSMLRWIEDRLPHQVFAHHTLRFARDRAPGFGDLRALLHETGFRPGRLSCRLDEATGLLEYRVTVFCYRPDHCNEVLTARLLAMPGLAGFELAATDD